MRPRRPTDAGGYVIRPGFRMLYDSGSVPSCLVQKFASRRAYIYMLDVLAQILAIVTAANRLPA